MTCLRLFEELAQARIRWSADKSAPTTPNVNRENHVTYMLAQHIACALQLQPSWEACHKHD